VFGEPLGRLGIIARNHLASGYAEELPKSFFGLFQRYTVFLEFPWHVLLLAFVAATLYLLIKKKKWVKELTILHACFFFFLTFMVKSINPIVPVEAFIDRYFITNLPTMLLLIGFALFELISSPIKRFLISRKVMYSTVIVLVLFTIGLSAIPLPSGLARFYTSLSQIDKHPVPGLLGFQRLMNWAVLENIPIVSIDSEKPLDTANRVFYDNPGLNRSVCTIESLKLGSHVIFYFKEVGGAPKSLDR